MNITASQAHQQTKTPCHFSCTAVQFQFKLNAVAPNPGQQEWAGASKGNPGDAKCVTKILGRGKNKEDGGGKTYLFALQLTYKHV